jgi:hypothetical protein
MNLNERTLTLKQKFELGKNTLIEDSRVEISFFQFDQIFGRKEIQTTQEWLKVPDFCSSSDDGIPENEHFLYPVFHQKNFRSKECILLLHGLNERSWEKYLCWAEYLTLQTGKPVLLFPIAFHMNRCPSFWTDPRWVMPWLRKKKEKEDSPTLTFANFALSDRLLRQPFRFYVSGKETILNLCQLGREIRTGKHPFFEKDTRFDIFAYSIGALLSEVLLQADVKNLFSESRLFMFCGGALFNEMNGDSRMIMDRNTFRAMKDYYQHGFIQRCDQSGEADRLERSFTNMIDLSVGKKEREAFFLRSKDRIRAISLKKDLVMTTPGIINALGPECAKICLKEMDFDYEYSHEIPFPSGAKTDESLVTQAFEQIFISAASFLN